MTQFVKNYHLTRYFLIKINYVNLQPTDYNGLHTQEVQMSTMFQYPDFL